MIDKLIRRLDKSIGDLKKVGEFAQQTFILTTQLEPLVEMGTPEFLAEYFANWTQVSNKLLRYWSKTNHMFRMIKLSGNTQELPFGASSACEVAVIINEMLMTALSITASVEQKPVKREFLLNKVKLTKRLKDVWKNNGIRHYPWLFNPPFKGCASSLSELSQFASNEVAQCCRNLELEFRTESRPTENVVKMPVAVILFHGNRQYSIGMHKPITLTDNENNVLQSFLKQPSMDTRQLEKNSGVPLAARVLRSLKDKHQGRFAAAITTPSVKGKGGYQVNIQDVSKQSK